jgi:hypothetical protein
LAFARGCSSALLDFRNTSKLQAQIGAPFIEFGTDSVKCDDVDGCDDVDDEDVDDEEGRRTNK